MYAYFNIVHILFLFVALVGGVCLYMFFRERSRKVQIIFLMSCLAVCFFVGIVWNMIRAYKMGGTALLLANLPLFSCDWNIVLFPIVIFSKKDRQVLKKFILYYVIPQGISTLFMPKAADYTYMFYEYEVFASFLVHSLYIIVAACYFGFFHVRIDSRKPWKPFLLFMGMMTLVHGFNILMRETGVYPESNYFFTIDPFQIPIAWHCAVSWGYNLPYVYSYFFITVGYLAMTIFGYFVTKVVETEAFAGFVVWLKGVYAKCVSKVKSLFVAKRKPHPAEVPPAPADASEGANEQSEETQE